MPNMKLLVYTDGSCVPNPGVGGFAAIIYKTEITPLHDKQLTSTKKYLSISGNVGYATNNIAEMTAVTESLSEIYKRFGPSVVKIVTDSSYVTNAFNEGWLNNWESSGWRRKDGKPVANRGIWEVLSQLVNNHTSVVFAHVRGHRGHTQNELADKLASNAAKCLKQHEKKVEEYTDE